MLSGALGLQIIARRLGVELGEQQFNKISNVDDREISFADIKKLSSNHSIICRGTDGRVLLQPGDAIPPAGCFTRRSLPPIYINGTVPLSFTATTSAHRSPRGTSQSPGPAPPLLARGAQTPSP